MKTKIAIYDGEELGRALAQLRQPEPKPTLRIRDILIGLLGFIVAPFATLFLAFEYFFPTYCTHGNIYHECPEHD